MILTQVLSPPIIESMHLVAQEEGKYNIIHMYVNEILNLNQKI